jgi:uncharacterized membrane protein (UPF0127 family)
MRHEWACLRLVGSGRPVARSRRAHTLWERFRGLLLAPPLPPGEALWLPACGAVHTAFLRGAVDLLFLQGKRIVRVSSEVAPWRALACPGADSVIELAAGEVARLGLAPGQQLEVVLEVSGGEKTA